MPYKIRHHNGKYLTTTADSKLHLEDDPNPEVPIQSDYQPNLWSIAKQDIFAYMYIRSQSNWLALQPGKTDDCSLSTLPQSATASWKIHQIDNEVTICSRRGCYLGVDNEGKLVLQTIGEPQEDHKWILEDQKKEKLDEVKGHHGEHHQNCIIL